jgi:hypothetical protein
MTTTKTPPRDSQAKPGWQVPFPSRQHGWEEAGDAKQTDESRGELHDPEEKPAD